jgi:hypothetical protein
MGLQDAHRFERTDFIMGSLLRPRKLAPETAERQARLDVVAHRPHGQQQSKRVAECAGRIDAALSIMLTV